MLDRMLAERLQRYYDALNEITATGSITSENAEMRMREMARKALDADE